MLEFFPPAVCDALRDIADMTTPGGVEMGLFSTLDAAESWLNRPLTLLI